MTIPELKPEIWNNIFQYLYRQPPPAWEKADWSDLHQHDLTVVSRLSSIHHELAMSHLYSSVVVNGLPSLLAYDDHRTYIFWEEKTTPKRDRMAKFTKHIRIAAIPPPLNAPWTYADLLSVEMSWRDVGETDEIRKARWYKAADATLEEMRRILPQFKDGTRFPIVLPKLETVVISRDVENRWADIFNSSSNRFITRRLPNGRRKDHQMRSWATEFIADLNPRLICSHDTLGPYAPFSTEARDNTKLEVISVHHHQRFGYAPPIVYGRAENRHYINPLESLSPERGRRIDGSAGLGDLCTLTGEIARDTSHRSKKGIAQTKIELLGLFSGRHMIPARQAGEQTGRAWSRMDKEEALKREKMFLMDGAPMLKTTMFKPIWRNGLNFRAWDEIPRCEACGWSTAVAEEVYAR